VNKPHTRRLFLICLLPESLVAQTQIGGGTCSSSSLKGVYSATLTGRQLTSSATFASALQANGSATFDGQSKVTMQFTANTLQGVAVPLNYSGTYSIQANCAGIITITAGDAIAFNLEVYNQGNGFLITGSDATYAFTGGGNTQPASGCTVAKLAGVYTMNLTGYGLSGTTVNGIGNAAGLAQFDGVGAVTLNMTLWTVGMTSSTIAASGTYSIASSCLGTANLTDAKGNSYAMALSITAASAVAVNGLDITLAQASKFIISGAGHPVFGQPTAAASNRPHRGTAFPLVAVQHKNDVIGVIA
jgi:hypothetical protein